MRAALAAPSVLSLVAILAFGLALVAMPPGARADRRADIAALCDVSEGSGPAPIAWQAGRVVESVVLASQRLTRGWRGDGDGSERGDDGASPAPRLAFRQARVDRDPPRHRRASALAPSSARQRATEHQAPLFAQR